MSFFPVTLSTNPVGEAISWISNMIFIDVMQQMV